MHPIYTAVHRVIVEDLLPRHYFSETERDWYHRNAPALAVWLDGERRDAFDYDLARFAALVVLHTPVGRAYGRSQFGLARPPFSWEGIDAFEVIFENLFPAVRRDPERFEGVDMERILQLVHGAAEALLYEGVLPPETGEPFVWRDFKEWIPKALEAWNDGVEFHPSGKRVRKKNTAC